MIADLLGIGLLGGGWALVIGLQIYAIERSSRLMRGAIEESAIPATDPTYYGHVQGRHITRCVRGRMMPVRFRRVAPFVDADYVGKIQVECAELQPCLRPRRPKSRLRPPDEVC